MTSAVFLLYALGHLGLFAFALRLFLRWRHPATVPLLLVTFGLVYGNAMLALGGSIGHGPVLEQLSVPRFFMHALSTPLLMLTALGLVQRSGAAWAHGTWLKVAVALLTLAMIAVGFHADVLSLVLEPQQQGDLVSYGNAATRGLPIAPIVTILVLIGAGVVVWRHGGGIWMLAGAGLQFAAAALAGVLVFAGNLGELALLAGLVVTDWKLSEPLGRSADGR